MDERRVRSAARAVAGDFQTPLELARGVVRAVAETGVRPRAVLEPTCGKGAFLLAAREVFPRARLVGFDVNAEYVAEARRALGASARVEEADFFGVDWAAVLSELPAPVLVLGNPPWVTSATVSKLGGSNGPERTRRTGLVGLDAVTGASNFDISVWMLEELGRAALTRGASLAVLCKAQVARKMVSFFHREGVHAEGDIWKLDARRHFGASVDAVAFAARPASPRGAGGVFAVRPELVSAPVSRLGVRRGSLTGDVDAVGLEVGAEFEQLGAVLHLEGDVLHPLGRVRIASHRWLRRQFEEREHVAGASVQEDMHVRVRRLGRRHLVLGDGEHEVHLQHLSVPEHGLLGVTTAVGDVMDAVDLHFKPPLSARHGAPGRARSTRTAP